VLLDEIGDTSPTFQAKLLRVVQEREFYPVGSERPRTTEARVIASTNKDLAQLVAEGKFREDLFFRLRVVELRLPPLRERRSDIPLLVGHFLRRSALELGRPTCAITRDAMSILLSHDWPGNVRELQNTLARAVVLCRGSTITAEDISLAGDVSGPKPPPDDDRSLSEVQRRHVQSVLDAARGNKSEAARILGVSRPRLDRMVARWKLELY